ncbi:MAG: peptidoglycan/LPS O-acetylase OafA/YrhL [Flavobacteriales bacterium]|jgi:peptidoglycan/LPS O-acetylase OafA/YrhL
MKQFYPSITMLRGIAAMMVCVYHFTAYEDFRGALLPADDMLVWLGEFGVQGVFIFFVISGFVIPLSLEKVNFKLSKIGRFLAKRWTRIEIPYFMSIALVLVIQVVFAGKNGTEFSLELGRLAHHLLYTIPFSSHEWYNPIYWTLAIEFQFYIVIALLFPLLVSNKTWVVIFTLVVFALSGLLVDDHRGVMYYAPIFAQGMALFLWKVKRIKSVMAWSLIGGFVILTACTHELTIAVFALLAILAIEYTNVNERLTNYFGDISYSLYLTHGAIGGSVIYLLARHVDDYSLKIGLIIIAILASVVGAQIFWKIIENPSKALSKNMASESRNSLSKKNGTSEPK